MRRAQIPRSSSNALSRSGREDKPTEQPPPTLCVATEVPRPLMVRVLHTVTEISLRLGASRTRAQEEEQGNSSNADHERTDDFGERDESVLHLEGSIGRTPETATPHPEETLARLSPTRPVPISAREPAESTVSVSTGSCHGPEVLLALAAAGGARARLGAPAPRQVVTVLFG